MSYRDPDLWAANLQTMWYTKDRDQVGSVAEGLASWDGIGIYFNSSTSDVQVAISCSSSCLPVLTLILTILTLPMAQTDRHLPHRTALLSECWPVMGVTSRSSLGKGLRELSTPPHSCPILGLINHLYFFPWRIHPF